MAMTIYKEIILDFNPQTRPYWVNDLLHDTGDIFDTYDMNLEIVESDPHLHPVILLRFFTADGYFRFCMERM